MKTYQFILLVALIALASVVNSFQIFYYSSACKEPLSEQYNTRYFMVGYYIASEEYKAYGNVYTVRNTIPSEDSLCLLLINRYKNEDKVEFRVKDVYITGVYEFKDSSEYAAFRKKTPTDAYKSSISIGAALTPTAKNQSIPPGNKK